MITMTERQSRYTALALLIIVVVGLLAALSYPWVAAYTSQAVEIEDKQREIAAYRRLAGSEDTMQQELAALKRRNPAAGYFVNGETRALAAAKMQQYLKQIVDQNGGELISTQIVQQDESEGSATLRVFLRTGADASPQILYLLESGRPLLFIDKLTISARLARGSTPGATPLVSLDMNFDVTGYFQEGA